MKVTVTGGAGFIGANLCRALAANHAVTKVTVIDDLSTGHRDNLDGTETELIEASILDHDALDIAVHGASCVVHLAALGSVPRSVAEPMPSHAANATGTLAVLEAARRHGNPQIIFAGSSSVYGRNPTLPKHEGLATLPISPYAASKQAAEGYVLAYAATYGLPVLAFRFFNVFGPFQRAGHAYAAVIPSFVDAALRGQSLAIHGDGTQSRDFTYVDSVCAVIVEAILRQVTAEAPVNLAFGSRISLLEVVELLAADLGHPIDVRFEPPRPGDVAHSEADPSRLRQLFANLEPTPFGAGLTATVAWMRGALT